MIELGFREPLRCAELQQAEQRRSVVAVLEERRVVAAGTVCVLGDADHQGFLPGCELHNPQRVEVMAAVILLSEVPACG